MKRRLLDRIHDRSWREIGDLLTIHSTIETSPTSNGDNSSISSSTSWATICSKFADKSLESHNFRRTTAVRNIVETVGAVEGAFYAGRIREWGPEWLDNPQVEKIDLWGNPIRWPSWLLGTPRAFSPTTLRYLATTLWLKRVGYLDAYTELVEIGVGFGGLAAMNAIVSNSQTILVDLPDVERSAMRMLAENNLSQHARLQDQHARTPVGLVISNYAFTELNTVTQNEYFYRYLKNSAHGVIISNSSVFASVIGGRTDEDLIGWFQSEGLPAKLETSNDLLGPGDQLSGVSMIHW